VFHSMEREFIQLPFEEVKKSQWNQVISRAMQIANTRTNMPTNSSPSKLLMSHTTTPRRDMTRWSLFGRKQIHQFNGAKIIIGEIHLHKKDTAPENVYCGKIIFQAEKEVEKEGEGKNDYELTFLAFDHEEKRPEEPKMAKEKTPNVPQKESVRGQYSEFKWLLLTPRNVL